MAENKSLTDDADTYFQGLLKEAQEDDVEKRPPFEQRVALGSAFTRYLAVRNKLDPPQEEEPPIAQFAKQLNGGLRRRGANPPASGTSRGNGAADSTASLTERPN